MLRFFAAFISLILALAAADALARTWTNATGAVQIEAELIEKRADGTVVLKRANGVTITTKPEKLSAADQEYIRQWKPPAKEKPDDDFDTSNAFGPEVAEGALTREEKAALDKIKSSEANAAVAAYDQREKQLCDTHAAKRKEYREKLAELLDAALKDATAGGNLDDAVAIRDAIKALREGKDPPVAAEGMAAGKTREDREANRADGDGSKVTKPAGKTALLAGNWKVSDTTISGHLEVWTFDPNGTVRIAVGNPGAGEWTIERNRVLIKWTHMPDGKNLIILYFPLNKAIVFGDSFTGVGVMRASKISEDEVAAIRRVHEAKTGKKGRAN